MAETNPLLAIGDTFTVKLPALSSEQRILGVIKFNAGAAGPTIVMEVSGNDGVSWVIVKLQDPTLGEYVTTGPSAFTTDGQHGFIFNSVYTHVRLRVTAFTTPGSGVACQLRVGDAD